ncbi:hypothetical protein Poli38472_001872 [Pythium oligandrum]|uniref:Mis18 domain-containing protein n=1 Tax=Pythium oligandrum TaxID=41045 RepID=A0A8K1CW57_PYTOL|nr:hypothetical protein Poli38472_001872 [Pythium oligandrum]|eukprot:TMW69716.1 hypothetical protein Poli38472_001872 [Pythium oligandrum]
MARKRLADDDEFIPSDEAETTVHTPRVKKAKPQTPAKSAAGYGSHNGSATLKKTPVKSVKSTPMKRPGPTKTVTPARSRVNESNRIQHLSGYFAENDDDEESVDDAAAESEEVFDGEEDDDDEEDEDDEVTAPVVFQCGTCRSIFGDSYSFVSSNAELLLVTLNAVTNVAVAPEALTAKDGPDIGSAFQELLCKQCQTVLGRKYLTTPNNLDAIRGLYSFSTTCIASYQLGYPQLNQTNGENTMSSKAIAHANQECQSAINTLSMDRKELMKLRDDMTKVQNVLLVVDQRLHQLETQVEDSEAEEDDDVPRR